MKYNKKYYNKVCELASYLTNTINPKMKWMWGEALLGYALDELDKFNNRNDHTDFLIKYCDYWVKQNPKVDQSDTLAPGLITYAMYKRTGNEAYKKLTDKVLDYIQNEPRLIGNSLNHLGSSFKAKLYPKSVWVDSLMMFSVFTSLYGNENHDKELIDYIRNGKHISLAGKTDLMDLVEVFSRAKVVLAPDSGSAHLAWASANPAVVTIFTCTPKGLLAPYGDKKKYIAVGGEALGCQPCFRRKCPRRKNKNICMDFPSPNDVVKVVQGLNLL